jgi:glucose/arabinose dehydrogenase
MIQVLVILGPAPMKRTLVYAALLCVLTGPVLAQQGDGTDVPARVNTFKPDKVPATDQRIAALKVPQGFEVKAFAKDLKNIRIIAVAPNGDIYVSRREQGDVLLLKTEPWTRRLGR